MRVAELSGAKLDYWVYRALHGKHLADLTGGTVPFSTNWRWGGPIIDLEGIGVGPDSIGPWKAWKESPDNTPKVYIGETALIAAMRRFVALNFGPEVSN